MSHHIDLTLQHSLDAAESKHEKAKIIAAYIKANGQSNYDESVTQYQHAIQSAYQAKQNGSSELLVSGALLHDLGHLLVNENTNDSAFLEENLNHEEIAAKYLAAYFPEEVLSAIRLHVPAKRYICTVDDEYYNQLSLASKRSFMVQGGKMTKEEIAKFEDEPYYREAVTLRKWDDNAKKANAEVPEIEVYEQELESAFLN
jgi:phosphonate degradation associated HDIG domain protein